MKGDRKENFIKALNDMADNERRIRDAQMRLHGRHLFWPAVFGSLFKAIKKIWTIKSPY